jgi:hypothetical protein
MGEAKKIVLDCEWVRLVIFEGYDVNYLLIKLSLSLIAANKSALKIITEKIQSALNFSIKSLQ